MGDATVRSENLLIVICPTFLLLCWEQMQSLLCETMEAFDADSTAITFCCCLPEANSGQKWQSCLFETLHANACHPALTCFAFDFVLMHLVHSAALHLCSSLKS